MIPVLFLGLAYDFRWSVLWTDGHGGWILEGVLTTLKLSALGWVIACLLGIVFGAMRTAPVRIVRWAGAAYVEFFRSMPPIVLIVFTYLITLALLAGNERFDATELAPAVSIVALAAHSGAYQAEIVRAGILSVPESQREAAEAIGMTREQIMYNVTLPQMFRVSLPALGNEFASVIKDTSLLATVSILELTFIGVNLVSTLIQRGGNPDLVFVVWIEIAALYFVLTFAVSRILHTVERRYRVPGLEAPQL